jgi:hypothetical protein
MRVVTSVETHVEVSDNENRLLVSSDTVKHGRQLFEEHRLDSGWAWPVDDKDDIGEAAGRQTCAGHFERCRKVVDGDWSQTRHLELRRE